MVAIVLLRIIQTRNRQPNNRNKQLSLTPIFPNGIRTNADKTPGGRAFYASCSCPAGSTTCTCHDHDHQFTIPNIDHLSASERADAADKVAQRILNAPFEQQQEFLKQLNLTKRKSPEMTTQFADILQGAATNSVRTPITKAGQYQKLSEYLRSSAIPDRENLIEDVISMAHELPAPTLRKMSNRLLAAARAQDEASTTRGVRLRHLQAAKENPDDPKIKDATSLAVGEMRRLDTPIFRPLPKMESPPLS
jgi:hypothetical protein